MSNGIPCLFPLHRGGVIPSISFLGRTAEQAKRCALRAARCHSSGCAAAHFTRASSSWFSLAASTRTALSRRDNNSRDRLVTATLWRGPYAGGAGRWRWRRFGTVGWDVSDSERRLKMVGQGSHSMEGRPPHTARGAGRRARACFSPHCKTALVHLDERKACRLQHALCDGAALLKRRTVATRMARKLLLKRTHCLYARCPLLPFSSLPSHGSASRLVLSVMQPAACAPLRSDAACSSLAAGDGEWRGGQSICSATLY